MARKYRQNELPCREISAPAALRFPSPTRTGASPSNSAADRLGPARFRIAAGRILSLALARLFIHGGPNSGNADRR